MRPLYRPTLLYAHPVSRRNCAAVTENFRNHHEVKDYFIARLCPHHACDRGFFGSMRKFTAEPHDRIVALRTGISQLKVISTPHNQAIAFNSAVTAHNSPARHLFRNSINLTTNTRYTAWTMTTQAFQAQQVLRARRPILPKGEIYVESSDDCRRTCSRRNDAVETNEKESHPEW